MLGPVLLLALALQGRWGLHASAAAHGAGVFRFLGESGVGKSTLAAGLAGGWQPLADDLLPIRLPPSGPRILPRYPQLKVAEQWAPRLPDPFGTYIELTEGLNAYGPCQCALMNAAICFIAASPCSPIFDMMLPCVRSAISTVSTVDPAFESSVFSRSFCARRQSSSPSA